MITLNDLPVTSPVPFYSDFKGAPILNLVADDGLTFAFGERKAKLMAAHMDAISAFCAGASTDDKKVTTSVYKGHTLLVIDDGTKFGLSFGRDKAQLVLLYREHVEAFAKGDRGTLGAGKPAITPPTPEILTSPVAFAAYVFALTVQKYDLADILSAVEKATVA